VKLQRVERLKSIQVAMMDQAGISLIRAITKIAVKFQIVLKLKTYSKLWLLEEIIEEVEILFLVLQPL